MALQQSSALQKLKLLVQLEEEEANNDYDQGRLLLELHRESIPRSCWVRSWICRRNEQGQFNQLMRELEEEDQDAFTNFLRITPAMFTELEQRLHGRLEKQDTWRTMWVLKKEKVVMIHFSREVNSLDPDPDAFLVSLPYALLMEWYHVL